MDQGRFLFLPLRLHYRDYGNTLARAYNPGTEDVEAGILGVQGPLQLHSVFQASLDYMRCCLTSTTFGLDLLLQDPADLLTRVPAHCGTLPPPPLSPRCPPALTGAG